MTSCHNTRRVNQVQVNLHVFISCVNEPFPAHALSFIHFVVETYWLLFPLILQPWMIKTCRFILVKLECGDVGYCVERKFGELGKLPLEQDENQQQTQPTYMYDSGTKSKPHWWEASFVTTDIPAPLLLLLKSCEIKWVLKELIKTQKYVYWYY